MTRKAKRRWVIAGLLAAGWLILSQGPLLLFEMRVRDACRNADRLVMDFNVAPESTAFHERLSRMPALTIGGREKAQEFERMLRFKTHWSPLGFSCRCLGEAAFRIERSGQPPTVLTFHHGDSLRLRGMNGGDFELTQASQADLRRWLEHNLGEHLRKAETESQAIWRGLGETHPATATSSGPE